MGQGKAHLSALRKRLSGMGQRAAAERLHTTQSTVSKLEANADPQLTNLRAYVRRVLGGELILEAEVAGERYPLALGPDPRDWSGPLAAYPSRDELYADYPHLAAGWGWRPGSGHGNAPYGSDELSSVRAERYLNQRERLFRDRSEWLITVVAPENLLGMAWSDREDPAEGAVTATMQGTVDKDLHNRVLLLGVNLDVRPVAKHLRLLQNPSLEEVGAAIEHLMQVSATEASI